MFFLTIPALSHTNYTDHTYTHNVMYIATQEAHINHYTLGVQCIHTHTQTDIRLFTVTVTVSVDPPLVQVYSPASDKLTDVITRM